MTNFSAKLISLTFNGYRRDTHRDGIPDKSGIYLVYAGTHKPNNTVHLRKLLYIGESDNLHDRLANHDRYEDWTDALQKGEILYYAYALASQADRLRAEAALIYQYTPPFNTEYTDHFRFPATALSLTGLGKNKDDAPFGMQSHILVKEAAAV